MITGFLIYLVKLVITGFLLSIWICWIAYKIVGVIDKNTDYTEPKQLEYNLIIWPFKMIVWLKNKDAFSERPKLEINLLLYSIIALFLLLIMWRV